MLFEWRLFSISVSVTGESWYSEIVISRYHEFSRGNLVTWILFWRNSNIELPGIHFLVNGEDYIFTEYCQVTVRPAFIIQMVPKQKQKQKHIKELCIASLKPKRTQDPSLLFPPLFPICLLCLCPAYPLQHFKCTEITFLYNYTVQVCRNNFFLFFKQRGPTDITDSHLFQCEGKWLCWIC